MRKHLLPPARFAALVLTALLGACGPKVAPLDTDTLNREIDQRLGGIDTCVVILDTATGRRLYTYGQAETCAATLPPCDLFDIPLSLIGLDQGVIKPGQVVRWDGSPEPVAAWRTNADLAKAMHLGVGWWFARLATSIGHDRMAGRLKDLNYGDHNTAGPVAGFWMGPQAGGALTTTEDQQVDFIRRFYAGDLKLAPAAIAAVQAATVDEIRPSPKGGAAQISGLIAGCPTTADGARTVSWWVGRVRSGAHDIAFSASIEGTDAPPGLEIEQRLKDIFVDAGILPAAG